MKEFIQYKLWSDFLPTQPVDDWILTDMFRVIVPYTDKPKNHKRAAISQLQTGLGLVDDKNPARKYLNSWNSARSDLISSLIPNPKFSEGLVISPQIEPPEDMDIAYWMASYLYGFTDNEISILVPGYTWEHSEVMMLMPFLRSLYRRVRSMPVIKELYRAGNEQTQLVCHYQRTKYLLFRYYLDAVYHQIDF